MASPAWGGLAGLAVGLGLAYASMLVVFARCESAPCRPGILLIPLFLIIASTVVGWRLHAMVLRHRGGGLA